MASMALWPAWLLSGGRTPSTLPPPLAAGATLVSHNLSEFERIEGLSLEDWAN